MSLSKEQRDNLSESDFAVPGKRALPLPDERHVRMAWSMVDRTKGLTESERAEARRRILARAKSMGIDTAEWEKLRAAEDEEADIEVESMQLEAMSLSIPKTDGHPNKMNFRGILTRVGVPSDKPPGGSGGRKVIVSVEAAQAALPTLLGMGVGITRDFDGHDPRAKVGIITDARVEGDALMVEGFVYAADFPKEAARIKQEQDRLGFSYELAKIRVSSLESDPLVVTACCFTGAAILLKDKAAYTSTQLAAKAADRTTTMTDEELKKAIADSIGGAVTAAIAPIAARLDTIEASQAALAKRTDEHAALVASVEPIAADLEKTADGMDKAGIKGGEALRAQARNMRLEAASGRAPSFHAGAAAPAKVEDEGVKALRQELADIRAANEKAAKEAAERAEKAEDALKAANTKIEDLKLAAQNGDAAKPERKTIPPVVQALIDKGSLALPEGDGKLTASAVDEALRKTDMSINARMTVKGALHRAGLL